MAYIPYVTATEYAALGFNSIPENERDARLKEASRSIDTLTFNRIVSRFDKLTEYQQEIVKECVCRQADFLYENADAISSILDSYAINGVAMHFGTGFNVRVEGGEPVQSTTYSLLCQTGLCCRLAR